MATPETHAPAGDPAPQLAVDVRSPDGGRILAAGTELTASVLTQVAEAGRQTRRELRSLLEHGTVRRDLGRAARSGPYRVVFGSDAEYRALEEVMAAARVPEPCLRGLDWFFANDPYTYRHILVVFALSCLMVERAGRTRAETAAQAIAGPLHDFGKLCVPREVLVKGTPLTHAERRLLEQHTLAGHVLLAHFTGDPDHATARVARDHHERRDRSGYPRAIPLADALVEIVAVCDVYDALVSPRPYRFRPFDNRSALEEVTALAERGRVGWDAVRLLVALNRRARPEPERVDVSLEKRGSEPEGNLYGVYSDGD